MNMLFMVHISCMKMLVFKILKNIAKCFIRNCIYILCLCTSVVLKAGGGVGWGTLATQGTLDDDIFDCHKLERLVLLAPSVEVRDAATILQCTGQSPKGKELSNPKCQ